MCIRDRVSTQSTGAYLSPGQRKAISNPICILSTGSEKLVVSPDVQGGSIHVTWNLGDKFIPTASDWIGIFSVTSVWAANSTYLTWFGNANADAEGTQSVLFCNSTARFI
eukprot:TRINITY_DN10208_c0_g1_i1.p1 TRINITY_DN10208_c0_g1~~TRINITY_DN10208_c0_g1_i1.p1  ORF type:complete len:110 (-),score=16.41 TRINITY_DN10208_c0_g1_i1:68-397(-)